MIQQYMNLIMGNLDSGTNYCRTYAPECKTKHDKPIKTLRFRQFEVLSHRFLRAVTK